MLAIIFFKKKVWALPRSYFSFQRFLPSEFGSGVDRLHGVVEPAASLYRTKAEIRRAVEAEGIPYTYLVSNGFAGYLNYFLNPFGDSSSASPPRDKIVILGDGNPKVIFLKEEDIAAYTIKAADDPRTLNKIVYLRLPANTVLQRNSTIEVLEKIQEASMPSKFILSLGYTVFVKGEMANFEIEASFGMELYPDVKCTALDEYLNQSVCIRQSSNKTVIPSVAFHFEMFQNICHRRREIWDGGSILTNVCLPAFLQHFLCTIRNVL
ncbi:unnamed protein product [Coffea canephora]|uniref:NmrA-like domain-containing protein n=1 Tax=Coffea canephora TaxID=49390 RepID=A0A068UI55_COFCA|nr:unnamed protein product [Coffea canephora]